MTRDLAHVLNALLNSQVMHWLGRWLMRHNDSSGQIATNTRRVLVTTGDDCCGISDVGLVRPINEDAFFISPEQDLLVLADGLGGHAAGEVASALVIGSIRTTINDHNSYDDPVTLLDHVFANAVDAVHDHVSKNPDCAGMATTLIVALIRDDELILAHVGDVRAYHWRDGNLVRLTQDHTAVGRLLRAGLIEEDAARHHPARNQVSQAIGSAHDIVPEHVRLLLAPGDCLLLCSDGLWDEVPHADIADILADSEPAFYLTNRLVDKAIAAGGSDNITAVVYRHSREAAANTDKTIPQETRS